MLNVIKKNTPPTRAQRTLGNGRRLSLVGAICQKSCNGCDRRTNPSKGASAALGSICRLDSVQTPEVEPISRKAPKLASNSEVLAVLEQAWNRIQVLHPDVPNCRMVIATGGQSSRGLVKLGHWWAEMWTDANENNVGEVLIASEHLKDSAEYIFGTVLHEAAHAMGYLRKVRDGLAPNTSRGGKYHNKVYKALAEELGMTVERAGSLGWTNTTVTQETLDVYAPEIKALQDVLKFYKKTEGGGKKKTEQRNLKCTCACPGKQKNIIRMSRKLIEKEVIRCDDCGELFKPADETGITFVGGGKAGGKTINISDIISDIMGGSDPTTTN